ncbi:MAG TPA: gephyrin-like molybdotransferase Glp [Acidimicrobiales bacterium]|nr:gephyrin-like molybdotransferase Glp [Acidimicrobiales bacterium]
MISLADARSYVLSGCTPLESASVPLQSALGCVAAERVESSEPLPPFANTAMDGYAVRAADTVGAPVELDVVGFIAAGASGLDVHVGDGQAARIMTGAPMPAGADAVVMVERTVDLGARVRIEVSVEVGQSVRPAGDDLQVGDAVVDVGDVLTPAHLGLLATVGRREVSVVRRPRVGVLSTGDELVDGPATLAPGQIRDSNRPTLCALVTQAGFEAIDLGTARDDEAVIERALRDGVASCDALITSGGVSMGDLDYVKVVLDRIGDMRWMQVAIKPAKPLAFGTVDGTPVFGLPGNPVSSAVSFELFARPGLRRLAGFGDASLVRAPVRAVAGEAFDRTGDGKTHFVRVRVSVEGGRYVARSAGGQGSHQLAGLAAANALAVLHDGAGVGAGDDVEVLLLG